MVSLTASQNCKLVHCSYSIVGLTKGLPYYARVFAFNAFGYSQIAGIPIGINNSDTDNSYNIFINDNYIIVELRLHIIHIILVM